MKTNRFNANHFLKILFANKNIDKICWMLGFGCLFVAIICYVLALTTFISVSYPDVSASSYPNLVTGGLIFLSLSFLAGSHASVWMVLAFHDKNRLIIKKRILKSFCLGTFNIFGFYMIDYLLEKFLEKEETIAEVLLTNEHVLKKSNRVWQAFLIFFAMLSIITFLPMIFLTCWILSESHYVYLDESTIRDRIALVMESLFCLFPVFSLINLIMTMKSQLFIAWLEENSEGQINAIEEKKYWNRGSNILIWFNYYLSLVLFLVWFSLTMAFLQTHLSGFSWDNFFILFLWPVTSFLFFCFTAYKKFLWEMDERQSLWILVLEILTLNLFLMGSSLIFIYKNNQLAQESLQWKADLDHLFFWIILLNTLLAYVLIIGAIALMEITKFRLDIDWLLIDILFTSGTITFLHLVLNIWKMTDYKTYFNNLLWWVLIDLLTFDVLGLVFNFISKIKKEKLRNELVWI